METKGTFEILPIADIVIEQGFNVYTQADETLFCGLMNSLDEIGQLNPVIVNKISDVDGTPVYMLVAGQQRLQALSEMDAETVECKVFENMTELEKLDFSVDENERRRIPSPMDQARGMKRMRELGRSTKQIADKYSVSDDTVLRREKLLELPKDVQEMIERKQNPLPIHQAVLLMHPKLNESNRRQLARKIAPVVGPVIGEKETAAMIADIVEGPKLPDPGPKASNQQSAVSSQNSELRTPAPDLKAQHEQAMANAPKTPLSPEQKKNAKAAERLKPVKGCVAVGQATVDVDADGQLVVSGVLAIKLDTGSKHPQLHTVKVVAMPIEIGAKDTAEVVKMLKKCQPDKPARKTAKKKTT